MTLWKRFWHGFSRCDCDFCRGYDECRAALSAIVADLRAQDVHAGHEWLDDEYITVTLKAGDIRRAVAAVNAVGNSTASNLGKD